MKKLCLILALTMLAALLPCGASAVNGLEKSNKGSQALAAAGAPFPICYW